MEWTSASYQFVLFKILVSIKIYRKKSYKKNMNYLVAVKRCLCTNSLENIVVPSVVSHIGILFVGTKSYKIAALGIVRYAEHVEIGGNGTAQIVINVRMV
ncbi:MAG: hypothetical protein BA861_06650 [Desulfobacterales bacterium S3730MH5]|nr:MAG: hypothetical protein BA861_06650 [Desulfobacterales bacterium S3730MH5]